MFDIGAALTAGAGSFTVDDVAQATLVSALDHHPALRRSGNPNPPAAIAVDQVGPVVAHIPATPARGDILYRGADGQLKVLPPAAAAGAVLLSGGPNAD